MCVCVCACVCACVCTVKCSHCSYIQVYVIQIISHGSIMKHTITSIVMVHGYIATYSRNIINFYSGCFTNTCMYIAMYNYLFI